MHKKIPNYITNLLLIIIFITLIKNKDIINYSTIQGIKIFIYNLFPFLFIMIIIENLFLNYNLPYYINKIFKNKNISPVIIMVFILSSITGTPTNIIIISDLVKNKYLDIVTANKLLMSSFFLNPIFLVNSLTKIFTNGYTIKKIIILTYLTNILIGFITMPKKQTFPKIICHKSNDLAKTVNESIKTAINVSLNVMGSIILFMIIANVITSLINSPIITLICKSIFEITQGLDYLAKVKISFKIKEIIAIFIISFGGISIHAQVNSVIANTNLDYRYFLKGRIIATIINILFIIMD
jgi:hypothetical protein